MRWLTLGKRRGRGFRAAVALIGAALPMVGQTLLDNYTAEVLETMGAEQYRRGKPDQALSYYAKAVEKEPVRVSAVIGLAKIVESGFQAEAALKLFRGALALDPNNRDALAGISRLAESGEERLIAARKLLPLVRGDDRRWLRDRIRLMEAMGGHRAFEAVDPERPYRLDMVNIEPRAPIWLPFPAIPVKAPNGESFRFLIDTSTEGICMTEHAAEAFGAKLLFHTYYPWLRGAHVMAGQQGLIEDLALGDVRLRHCPVFVRNTTGGYGYGDGIIGVEALHDFLIEIDFPAAEVRLQPRSTEPAPELSKHFVAMRRFGPFLLVPVHTHEEQSPYFAVQAAASDVVIQDGMRPKDVGTLTGRMTHATGWCCTTWRHSIMEVTLIVASSRWSGRATHCRMGDVNREAGFKVSGFLGHSFLQGFCVVVDYCRGMMGFIPKKVK